MPRTARWMLALALAATPALATDIPLEPPPEYHPQTSEDNVLANLVTAYRHRDAAAYARLLAADYHVVLLPGQPGAADERWGRIQDSTSVAAVFAMARTIRIDLEWIRHSATPDNEAAPTQVWTRITSDSTKFAVELTPQPEVEHPRYAVTSYGQSWYFRRGFTSPPSGSSDTLTYIVELRDPS